jgi:predicted PurR-regulated permease PerM
MNAPYLTQTLRILLFFILSFVVLYFGKPVLVPLAFGGVFALLLIPVSRWLERHKCNRAISSLICVLVLVLVFSGIFLLLKWQMSDLAKDLDNIEQRLGEILTQIKVYIRSNLGISMKQQQKMINEQQSGMGKMSGMLTAVLGSFMGIVVNTVLVLVYMYLFLYLRNHFKNFVMQVTKTEEKAEATKVMEGSAKVIQSYLTGLGLMIVLLWVLYGIGFSIVGVKGAIFFAILCGVLELIPFVGNLTGTSITVLMAIAQGGDANMVVGVLVTYAIVQFTQTYILEPAIVGDQVNINPLFTILIIVVGETVWGIAGMILAIPFLGIVKIICDHVDSLGPYGYLIGTQKTKKKESIFKKWFSFGSA